MWYLVPRLPRSVGFGPVRSPPRLARTEQLSRIRSGSPRNIATRRAWTRCSRLTSAQSASRRRRVEPLARAEGARRLRHGGPSRRNRRRVASTRTVSAGGCPGPGSPGTSQRSITVAIRSKVLRSTSVPLPAAERPEMGIGTAAGAVGPSQPAMDVETASKGVDNGDLSKVAWSADGASLYAAGRWWDGSSYGLRRWPEGGRGAPVDLSLSGSTVM